MTGSTQGRRTPGIKKPKDAQSSTFAAPEGFWVRCTECHAILEQARLQENVQVCFECSHHFRIGAKRRLVFICDKGSFVEKDADLKPRDILEFYDSKSYADRLEQAAKKTNLPDAFVSGTGQIQGRSVEVGAFEFGFMGGSMGTVVGEKVSRLFDRAFANKSAAIVFHASGGARMQEGILSLMQMAKTTVALSRLKDAGLPYISVMTDPTTGGVAASFAMLGDLNIAEPLALIGFAGPRVVKRTGGIDLPAGFQTSEFRLEHGFVDRIVARPDLRTELSRLIDYCEM